MDDEVLNRFVEDINPQRGIESEVNRLVRKSNNNQSKASPRQLDVIRDRIVSGNTSEGMKFQKKGKDYIRVDKNTYKRVLRNEDVHVSRDGDTVWLRDSEGKYKEVIDE